MPNWTVANLALLGKLPDHEAAERIGCSTIAVFMHRNKLAIPPYPKFAIDAY